MLSAKLQPYLGSSANPTQLALTIQGILVGIGPMVLYILKAQNIEVSDSAWGEFVESVVQLVTYGGMFASSLMIAFGCCRKVYYRIKK
jgi:hypothetical protein